MGSGNKHKRPFRQRPHASSNAALFEKRGDSWVSPRQQLEDFGRVLSTENPDFDAVMRAGRAVERPEGPSPKGKPTVSDDLRKRANRVLKARPGVNAVDRMINDRELQAKIAKMRKEDEDG